MPENKNQNEEFNFFFPWLNPSFSFWSQQAEENKDENGQKIQAETGNRFLEQWQQNLNLMKAFSQAIINEPESTAAAIKAISTLPEIILKMAKSGMEAGSQTQQHILEKIAKIGQRADAYNFDNLDQEVFKALSEIYEKELRQYFHIPQLGLTRFYQERFTELLDKKNIFEATAAEFLSIIYLPIEKSYKVFQDELQAMAQEGKLPKDAKDNYAIWVRILEGHYMNLFQSKEYTDALHNTLDKMEDFILAKDDALRDILQFLPIPTSKEMDELYMEFYQLKKRVKELENKIKSM